MIRKPDMKTKPQLINAIFLVVLTAFAHRSVAADFSAAELNHRIIERRAVVAVIWACRQSTTT